MQLLATWRFIAGAGTGSTTVEPLLAAGRGVVVRPYNM